MDLGKSFTFMFDDEQWVTSILIAAALVVALFIPIVNFVVIFALAGYALETARNVMQSNPRPLPQWNNFGEKLKLGFLGAVIQFVYALPIVIIALIGTCVAIFPIIGSGGESEEAVIAAMLGLMACIVPIAIIGGLALLPLGFAATGRYLQTNDFGSAFQFGEVFRLVRANLGTWAFLVLIYFLAQIIASAGASVFLIGMLFTYPYAQLVFGHALGQVLRSQLSPSVSDFPTQNYSQF